jgi:hypothetical protein
LGPAPGGSRVAAICKAIAFVVLFLRAQARQPHSYSNQRLAALHTLFLYVAGQAPETLAEAERVAAIPMKRVPPPSTRLAKQSKFFRHVV